MYWVLDGHHRNFAAASHGINLIPYTIREEENEKEEYTVSEQIELLKSILGKNYRSILYTYEEAWRDEKTKILTYKYEDAYPRIYGLQQGINIKNQSESR